MAKRATPVRKQAPTRRARADVPKFFRLNLEVADLARATEFYGRLLGIAGRPQRGARVYFDCGGVTLQVVDVSSEGAPHPAAKCLYFSVRELDAVFARAKELGALSRESIHGSPGGTIAVRPWGERSFYAVDPWANPLCFVEAGSEYTG